MLTPIRFLFLGLLGLSGLLASQWVDEQGRPRVISWQAPQAIEPSIPAVPDLPERLLKPAEQLLTRPLFTPDRKPLPPPPPPKAEAPPDPMNSVQLLGTIGGEAGGVIAAVDGAVRRIMLSQNIGMWKLDSVEGRNATFTKESETRVLTLAFGRLGEVPTVVAPAPAAARAPVAAAGVAAGTVGQRTQDELRERQRLRAEARQRAGMAPLVP